MNTHCKSHSTSVQSPGLREGWDGQRPRFLGWRTLGRKDWWNFWWCHLWCLPLLFYLGKPPRIVVYKWLACSRAQVIMYIRNDDASLEHIMFAWRYCIDYSIDGRSKMLCKAWSNSLFVSTTSSPSSTRTLQSPLLSLHPRITASGRYGQKQKFCDIKEQCPH